MSNSISRLVSSGFNLVQRSRELGRAVQHEVAAVLENPDTTVIGRLTQAVIPGKASAPSQTAQGSVLFRRALKDSGLNPSQKETLGQLLATKDFKDCAALRLAVEQKLGAKVAADLSGRPNLLPCLLAEQRDCPPLKFKKRLALDGSSLKSEQISFANQDGKLFANVSTSLNQLLGEGARAAQIAEDYASSDIPLKLTVPLGEGTAQDCQQLPLAARRQLVMTALRAAPGVTAMVHGFQSTKEIWDSTRHTWMEPGFVGIACDGFGSGGQARSDGSAPYTPKQYAFQMLEALDALGLLGTKQLHVVGHSMGGAATGEMAVALNKAGFSGPARFLMMAPACSSDHLPVFQGHRDLVDVVNAVMIGGIYVPMGALQWTAPLVDWTDRKFPELSRWMVDYGLGLKDSPEHIRHLNADYYRADTPEVGRARRSRSFEAMMGMATQSGLNPKDLRQAAQNFGIFTVHFGADRLVSPEASGRLKGDGVGSWTVGPASHNACFNPDLARRIAVRSQRHFEKHSSG
ncbi:alpha/beta hydrolase [bacterium]|nr:alpha/beta hydrolase [bacterium]